MTGDRKEKRSTRKKFLFDFRQRTTSTFASRAFLLLGNLTSKSHTASGKPAKELVFASARSLTSRI